MAFYGLRLKYALEGSSNYIAWKDRIEDVLEDNGLKNSLIRKSQSQLQRMRKNSLSGRSVW